MMGRLYDPDCDSCSCAAAAGFASSPWARVPTPAATAPRTEVLTKSRRENDMGFLLLAGKREAYHAGCGFRGYVAGQIRVSKKYRSNPLNSLESMTWEESIPPES